MRLHMDVYRCYIADALFMALKKNKTQQQHNGGSVGGPVMVLRGGSILSWLQLLFWSLVRQIEKVCLFHLKGATEVKECLLRYIVLKTQHFCICIYRCVPVALWWLCSHGWRDNTLDLWQPVSQTVSRSFSRDVHKNIWTHCNTSNLNKSNCI